MLTNRLIWHERDVNTIDTILLVYIAPNSHSDFIKFNAFVRRMLNLTLHHQASQIL